MRQPPRNSAAGRDDVDVGVAVVVAAEGDQRAVGRELGEHLAALGRAEPPGRAPGLRHRPQIAGVDEDDLLGADVGKTQHARVRHVQQVVGRDAGRDAPEQQNNHKRRCDPCRIHITPRIRRNPFLIARRILSASKTQIKTKPRTRDFSLIPPSRPCTIAAESVETGDRLSIAQGRLWPNESI